MARVLQTVMVRKSAAPTLAKAKKLAKPHADRIYTSRQTKNFWRFRQRPPACFSPTNPGYKTVCIQDGNVCLVYATLRKDVGKKRSCR